MFYTDPKFALSGLIVAAFALVTGMIALPILTQTGPNVCCGSVVGSPPFSAYPRMGTAQGSFDPGASTKFHAASVYSVYIVFNGCLSVADTRASSSRITSG
jgi:hypothetical protein